MESSTCHPCNDIVVPLTTPLQTYRWRALPVCIGKGILVLSAVVTSSSTTTDNHPTAQDTSQRYSTTYDPLAPAEAGPCLVMSNTTFVVQNPAWDTGAVLSGYV